MKQLFFTSKLTRFVINTLIPVGNLNTTYGETIFLFVQIKLKYYASNSCFIFSHEINLKKLIFLFI